MILVRNITNSESFADAVFQQNFSSIKDALRNKFDPSFDFPTIVVFPSSAEMSQD